MKMSINTLKVMQRRAMRGEQGFTLIEVMVVVVILSILAAIIVPRIMDRPDKARIVKAQSDIRSLESALNLYRLDNHNYPDLLPIRAWRPWCKSRRMRPAGKRAVTSIGCPRIPGGVPTSISIRANTAASIYTVWGQTDSRAEMGRMQTSATGRLSNGFDLCIPAAVPL